MAQTKKQSLIESKTNILIGLPINYGLNYLLIPLMGDSLISGKHHAYFTMTAVFTVVAIIRSYTIRRMFNRRVKNG